jgi:hypothetical protein
MNFLEFKRAFTKSEYSFPLDFWMPSLNSRMNFLEFKYAEPKYTCVFPSRSQWAVAALNNSCSNDPYVPMTSNHGARWMSWSLQLARAFALCVCTCTVVQSFIKRDAGIFKTYSSSNYFKTNFNAQFFIQ